MEVWLRPNSRIFALGFTLAATTLLVCAATSILVSSTPVRQLAWGLAGVGLASGLIVLWQWRRPRIGYRNGQVLFFLRSSAPYSVPVEVVEGFFVGQGPAYLPVGKEADFQSLNLVARLSRRAPEWSERDVKNSLARWHDGYVSIRGTWCEPLNEDLLRRLNRRLREVTKAERELNVAEN